MRKDKLTKAAQKLSKDAQFFYLHAGYSYDSKIETPDAGRIRCAVSLADAEAYATANSWEFLWEDDWSIGSHVKEYGKDSAYSDGEPSTCERCVLRDEHGHVLASLGCIDDADADYRRVIQAELAFEALHEIREAERINAEVDRMIALQYAL